MDNTKKINKVKGAISGAGKSIVKTIDQNKDGKLNAKDFSIVANKASNSLVERIDFAKKSIDKSKLKNELERLQPVFKTEISSPDFSLPEIIRVANKDKAHASSKQCNGSIGHFSKGKNGSYLTIYQDKLSNYDITLYPSPVNGFYYIDPFNENRYIEVNAYFDYLNNARINELEMVAQSLGAKRFRIAFNEKNSTAKKDKAKGEAGAQKKILGKNAKATAKGSIEKEKADFKSMDLLAEDEFPGCKPTKPKLKYLAKDPDIEMLIKLRMHRRSPINKKTLRIKYDNSCGMKKQDAAELDAAIKGLTGKLKVSFENEVQKEMERYLEYKVQF